jgi:hypothetical protein
MMVTSKMRATGFGTLALCLLIMAGCSPRELETTPVRVATPKGDVICQLYTLELVYWDRAIHVPAGMNPDEADNICRAKGDEVAAEIRTHKP